MIFTLLTILYFQNFTYVSNVRVCTHVCMCVCTPAYSVAKLCDSFETPWTIAHQAPLSMGLSGQE